MQLFMHCGVHSVHDLKRGPCYKKNTMDAPCVAGHFYNFKAHAFSLDLFVVIFHFQSFVLFLFYSSLALLCLS